MCLCTFQCSGTYSSTSETSSASARKAPPHWGQLLLPVAGSWTCGTRGSCVGKGLRAALVLGSSAGALGAGSAAALASNSSRLNSSWAICASSCSEERPNFKRFSRASCSFNCSINTSRDRSWAERLSTLSRAASKSFWRLSTSVGSGCARGMRQYNNAQSTTPQEKPIKHITLHSNLRLRGPHRMPPVDPFEQHRQLCAT
jgi:hypothetical protein